jgi:hypothetical protein
MWAFEKDIDNVKKMAPSSWKIEVIPPNTVE